MALPVGEHGETLIELRRHQRRRLLDQLAASVTDQQPLPSTILIVALALQQTVLFEAIEQTGERVEERAER